MKSIFKVYYGNFFVGSVMAETKWEAIEKVYSKMINDHPSLIRGGFNVRKI
jgi:hypothetical protein